MRSDLIDVYTDNDYIEHGYVYPHDTKEYSNNSYKLVKFIFDKYHKNWKYFYLIVKDYNDNYTCTNLDTTKINNDDYLDNFVSNMSNYSRITSADYDCIIKLKRDGKPLYHHMMPENITEFQYVYVESKTLGYTTIYAMSDTYLYVIFSQR